MYEWTDGPFYEGQWKSNMMHGLGFYKWLDGRKFVGEYHKDRKQGFGILSWHDGREYRGYFANGKQHGPGAYFKPVDNKTRYGIWELGKVVKWFDTVPNDLTAESIDFSKYFKNAESASLLPDKCKFSKPSDFDQRIQDLVE